MKQLNTMSKARSFWEGETMLKLYNENLKITMFERIKFKKEEKFK